MVPRLRVRSALAEDLGLGSQEGQGSAASLPLVVAHELHQAHQPVSCFYHGIPSPIMWQGVCASVN